MSTIVSALKATKPNSKPAEPTNDQTSNDQGTDELPASVLQQMANLLAYEEGYRSRAYHCSEGYPTIGYGFRLGPKHSALRHYQALNLPRRVGDLWLRILIEQYHLNLSGHPRLGPIMQRLNYAQQSVLVSMSYQLGIDGLLAFHKALSALEDQDLARASNQLLDSLWAQQTPERAERHSQQLASGRWAEVYRR